MLLKFQCKSLQNGLYYIRSRRTNKSGYYTCSGLFYSGNLVLPRHTAQVIINR